MKSEAKKNQNQFTGLYDNKDGSHTDGNGNKVTGANTWAQKESNDDPKAAQAAEAEATMEEGEKKAKEIADAKKADEAIKKEANKIKPHSVTGNLHHPNGNITHIEGHEIGGANNWIAKKLKKHHRKHHKEPKGDNNGEK